MANPIQHLKNKLFSEVTEVPALLQEPYLPSLDGLRGISIIIVLIFHVLIRTGYWGFTGAFGVDVFFVISGFIITTVIMKEKVKKGKVVLRNFYIRRFLKILPVAYIYLLMVSLINVYYHFVEPHDILSAALFIKNTNIIPTSLDRLTGHFWSLSVEEQFYIFFPFILTKSLKSYLSVILLLLVSIPLLLYFENHRIGFFGKGPQGHNFVDFFRHITPILTGALFSLLIFRKVIVKRIYPNNLVLDLAILTTAYFTFGSYGAQYFGTCQRLVSSFLIALVIVNNIIPSNGLFFRFLNSKILVTIGLASYSLYVWQQIFLLQLPWEHAFKYADTVWFNLLALFIVAFCSYYFIERNLLAFKRRFK